MKTKPDNIDQLLLKHLQNAEIDADGIGWDSFAQKNQKRRFFFWRSILGSVLTLLLVTGVAVFLSFEGKEDGKIRISGSNSFKGIKNENTEKSKDKNPVKETPVIVKSDLIQNEPNTMVSKKIKVGLHERILESKKTEANQKFENFTLGSYPLVSLHTYLKPVYSAELIPVKELGAKPVRKPEIKRSYDQIEFSAATSLNIPKLSLSEIGRSYIHKDYAGIRNASERAVAGYNLSAGWLHSIGNFKIGIGLGYLNYQIKGDYNFTYTEKPVLDTDGKIKSYLVSNPDNVKFNSTQKLSFFEIPVSIEYNIASISRSAFGIRFGYVNQFLNKIEGILPNPVFLDRTDQLSTENFKTASGSLSVALLFEHKLKNNSSIVVLPEFRRNLGLTQIESLYKTNFNYFGLNLKYRLAL
ncbi:MAG: hypothetical protein H6605_00905 [Flavobacteriales bacterium]|nr:hypothetical protein [Flavobacteriales bacterium]